MGEVATALAAFDDAFGRTLDALRASDVSEGSAWPTQKRASSLVLDLRRDVPAHVAAAKLVAAGELALSQGQWALAQTSCFAHVLALQRALAAGGARVGLAHASRMQFAGITKGLAAAAHPISALYRT